MVPDRHPRRHRRELRSPVAPDVWNSARAWSSPPLGATSGWIVCPGLHQVQNLHIKKLVVNCHDSDHILCMNSPCFHFLCMLINTDWFLAVLSIPIPQINNYEDIYNASAYAENGSCACVHEKMPYIFTSLHTVWAAPAVLGHVLAMLFPRQSRARHSLQPKKSSRNDMRTWYTSWWLPRHNTCMYLQRPA